MSKKPHGSADVPIPAPVAETAPTVDCSSKVGGTDGFEAASDPLDYCRACQHLNIVRKCRNLPSSHQNYRWLVDIGTTTIQEAVCYARPVELK